MRGRYLALVDESLALTQGTKVVRQTQRHVTRVRQAIYRQKKQEEVHMRQCALDVNEDDDEEDDDVLDSS